jgi:stigma-specific protein Stig1
VGLHRGIPPSHNSFCTNFQTDRNNCGSCHSACPGNQQCVNGVCQCPSTAPNSCNGICTDLNSDPNNCGNCGAACTGGQFCQAGTCQCPAGQFLTTGSLNNPPRCVTQGAGCPTGSTTTRDGVCCVPQGGTGTDLFGQHVDCRLTPGTRCDYCSFACCAKCPPGQRWTNGCR